MIGKFSYQKENNNMKSKKKHMSEQYQINFKNDKPPFFDSLEKRKILQELIEKDYSYKQIARKMKPTKTSQLVQVFQKVVYMKCFFLFTQKTTLRKNQKITI